MSDWFAKKGIFILGLITIFILMGIIKNERSQVKESQNLISSLSSEIQTWKDKDSINHVKIEVIETQSVKDFLSIKNKNTEIQKLQSVVKEYQKQLKNQGSVTNFVTNTEYVIKEIVKVDTAVCNFSFTKEDQWITLSVAGEGTPYSDDLEVNTSVKFRNEYSVIIGQESQGLFKQSKPFVEIKNYNPYSEVNLLRTYQVRQPKVKRFGIGPAVFVGYGFNGFNCGVGVAVTYSIFNF